MLFWDDIFIWLVVGVCTCLVMFVFRGFVGLFDCLVLGVTLSWLYLRVWGFDCR